MSNYSPYRLTNVLNTRSIYCPAGKNTSMASACKPFQFRLFPRNVKIFVLVDDGSALTVWHIAISENVVITILRFRGDSCGGTAGLTWLHFRTGGNACGFLVLLLLAIWRKVWYQHSWSHSWLYRWFCGVFSCFSSISWGWLGLDRSSISLLSDSIFRQACVRRPWTMVRVDKAHY